MCTLTFIPSSTNEVIITSNRDEHISRGNSAFPVTVTKKTGEVFFPQDPKAGGTWLAASNAGVITVLLNGAFEKHKHLPPYRLSRGIILLDSFDFTNLYEFNAEYDLNDIEPFTIVQFDLRSQTISELRWNGSFKHFSELDYSIPHIWSSATLYSKKIRTERENWFSNWLENPELNSEKMLDFHKFSGTDISNSISMNRGNGLQTVSISQLVSTGKQLNFTHHNLLNQTNKSISV